jgi:hypothetical protein
LAISHITNTTFKQFIDNLEETKEALKSILVEEEQPLQNPANSVVQQILVSVNDLKNMFSHPNTDFSFC